jgi:hypothetical protein
MRPIQAKNYRAVDMTAPITGEATPPAAAALVGLADEWCVGAAVSPYAGCGHVFDGLTVAGVARRYLAAVIAPGAVHARAALSRTWQQTPATGHSAATHELWSSDSGSTANELINVPGKLAGGAGYTPEPSFQYGVSDVALSGDGINDAPTAAQDRQLELQTAAAPYVEPLYVGDVSAFSLFVSDQVLDLETL